LESIFNDIIMEIKNETEYEKASERAEQIFHAKKGTKEFEELQVLIKALKEYEDDFVRMLKGFN
jgi:5'-deoxynucleotidase YfbR-like HD superfamily hydrolase